MITKKELSALSLVEIAETDFAAIYPANLVETLFAYESRNPLYSGDPNPAAIRRSLSFPKVVSLAEAEAEKKLAEVRFFADAAKETARLEREKERAEKAANRPSNGASPGRKGITRTESVAFALKANTALKTDLKTLAEAANRLFVEAGGDSNEKESRAVSRYAVAVLTAYGAI